MNILKKANSKSIYTFLIIIVSFTPLLAQDSGAPIWAFALGTGDYHVPSALGIGQLSKAGGTVFNFFIEPQYSVLVEDVSRPMFQIYNLVNL